ncbi:transporter [bacterium]|nr:transporter [bacterium]
MKFILGFLLIVLFGNTANAQFSETIRSSRPGQAAEPFSVGRHVFQLQTGLDAAGFNENKMNFSGSAFGHNTVFRFGFTDRFELNATYEFRRDGYEINDSTYSTSGLSIGSIGSRINIYEGSGQIPAFGLDLSFKLPVLSEAYDSRYVAHNIVLIASNSINDKLSWLLNLGTSYNGNDAKPTGIYVVNVGYALSSKWGTFIENYGNFTHGKYENRWDAGLAYAMNDNLQFDIYGGTGKNSGKFDYFTSIGLSWRTVSLRN